MFPMFVTSDVLRFSIPLIDVSLDILKNHLDVIVGFAEANEGSKTTVLTVLRFAYHSGMDVASVFKLYVVPGREALSLS